MSRTAIIYASKHHGSTYKLVKAISEKYDIDEINAEKLHCVDLSLYDLIGFASGIDFGKFYLSVERFLKGNLPKNKKVFFIYTCAKVSSRFTESMKEAALEKEAVLMGEYGCRGYNTYGPWKVIGGMNKNHPSQKEMEEAILFYSIGNSYRIKKALPCRMRMPRQKKFGCNAAARQRRGSQASPFLVKRF